MSKTDRDIIKIALVDDQPVFCIGLKTLLKKYPDIVLSVDCANAKEALEDIEKNEPDIALIGLNKPHMNGFQDVIAVKKRFPRLKIITLLIHENENYIMEIIRMGATGYVLKNEPVEAIIEAINAVHNNTPVYSSSIKKKILNQHAADLRKTKRTFLTAQLTPREIDVLILVVNGYTNKKIAKMLNISVRTVETHREHITQKLNIKTVAELTKYAISTGLTEVK